MVAAHELGHALTWHQAGIPIARITLRGEDRVRGWTELDGKEITSHEEMRSYLVGILAGEVAGTRWCSEHRIPRRAQHCDFDRAHYRQYRRAPLAIGLSGSELRAAARQAVGAHWSRIERLAVQLADRGTLRL